MSPTHSLETISSNKVFEGVLTKYKFKVSCALSYPKSPTVTNRPQSEALGGLDAHFNLFLPLINGNHKVPVLIYLAGLTCTEDNG